MTAVADTSAALGHEIDRSAAPLIRVEGVWKIFGRHADRVIGTPDADLPRAELREKHDCVAAVRDVSFEVWPSEVFVVMGLSGSGKSTLVRTLIRLSNPSRLVIGSTETPESPIRNGYSLVPCSEPRYLRIRSLRVEVCSLTRWSRTITQSETYSSMP